MKELSSLLLAAVVLTSAMSASFVSASSAVVMECDMDKCKISGVLVTCPKYACKVQDKKPLPPGEKPKPGN